MPYNTCKQFHAKLQNLSYMPPLLHECNAEQFNERQAKSLHLIDKHRTKARNHMPSTQFPRPAHIRHRFCRPRLLTEHEKHTGLPHAPQQRSSASEPQPSTAMISSSAPNAAPQSSQLVGAAHDVESLTAGDGAAGTNDCFCCPQKLWREG